MIISEAIGTLAAGSAAPQTSTTVLINGFGVLFVGDAGRGVRHGPQAGHFPILGTRHPHDQGRTAEHDHVAVPVGTRDQLLAPGIDRAGGQHGIGIAQYPLASGTSRAIQRRNSTVSPERNVVSAPVAPLPRLSPYNRPGVSGLPSSSTAVRDGTMAVTATAVASGLPS